MPSATDTATRPTTIPTTADLTTTPAGAAGTILAAALAAAESGYVPDRLLRWGIRMFAADRLRDEARRGDADRLRDLLDELRRSPIALHVERANEQHYELPPAFFAAVLGSRLKYSGAYWPAGVERLDLAEEAMLELTCQRAQIEDGMSVLDLGCGWGSLTLWVAERYPRCRVRAVSNSRPQAEFIRSIVARRGLRSRRGGHRRYQRLRSRRPVRPRRFGGDVRACAQLRAAARADRALARGRRQAVRTYLRPPNISLPLREHGCGRLDGTPFLHRRDDALACVVGQFPARRRPRRSMASQRTTLRPHRRKLARQPRRPSRPGPQDPDRRIRPRRRAAVAEPLAALFLACAEVFGYRQGREWGVSHYRFAPRG